MRARRPVLVARQKVAICFSDETRRYLGSRSPTASRLERAWPRSIAATARRIRPTVADERVGQPVAALGTRRRSLDIGRTPVSRASRLHRATPSATCSDGSAARTALERLGAGLAVGARSVGPRRRARHHRARARVPSGDVDDLRASPSIAASTTERRSADRPAALRLGVPLDACRRRQRTSPTVVRTCTGAAKDRRRGLSERRCSLGAPRRGPKASTTSSTVARPSSSARYRARAPGRAGRPAAAPARA